MACFPMCLHHLAWHLEYRKWAEGQGAGREGSLFKEGTMAYTLPGSAPSTVSSTEQPPPISQKALDGALPRVRGEAPLPSDPEPSRAHGLLTKHLQRAGCRRSPAGLARW